ERFSSEIGAIQTGNVCCTDSGSDYTMRIRESRVYNLESSNKGTETKIVHILGISAFYHDSAAALVRDGRIIAAAQEERFTRVKHDSGFPGLAVNYCLKAANITAAELDAVVFYEKPLLKAERLIETYLATAPKGLRSFSVGMPTWLAEKSRISSTIRKKLGKDFRGPLLFTGHHQSHAASAFYPSPFEEAAILTVDGVGEWST